MRILVVFLLLTAAGCGFQTEEADLVVHNATIYTVDAGFTIYEAMAIKDGKILELGQNAKFSISTKRNPTTMHKREACILD